ncbi:adenosine deaminase [Spirochaeta isovalerica]|uniref:adenosine deaminase n=1 Tax=Spirochaeta isovalerica TaxID=150 RepID=UPI001617F1D0|nr:adenosine deaminase [Spirochaeta isovalerica]
MKSSSRAQSVSLLDKSLLKTFPKVELHRHLEGMFSLKHLFELSRKNNLDTPEAFADFKKEVQFPKDSGPDFLLFLSKFKRYWYRSFDDIDYLVYHSVLNLKEEGLIYLELRFAPEHFAEYNDFDRIEVVKTVINAADRAAKEINLPINYLLTYNRMFQTAEQMIEQHKKIDKLEIPSIVGIDLAGDEVNYAPELYIPFFDYIKGLNKYKIDIHAGEITGPDQVWSAIEKLHADRIGHGISAIKDTKLLEYLKKNDIYLCQCITSNFQTGSWVDSPSHPLNDLYKMGYPVCINSDDPSVQDADLTDDYLKCVEYFDFSAEDFYKLNINAINASFISENEKRILISKFDKEYKVFLEKLK